MVRMMEAINSVIACIYMCVCVCVGGGGGQLHSPASLYCLHHS